MQPVRSARILTVLTLGLLALSCGGGGNPIIDSPIPDLIATFTPHGPSAE